MEIEPAIETTDDGSQTLRHPIAGETYHSTHGAAAEAEHVFVRAGFGAWLLGGCDGGDGSDGGRGRHVRVLEIGFGSGLNALLTLRVAERAECTVMYTAVELYPVSRATVGRMTLAADADFLRLHDAVWDEPVAITDRFVLHKIEGDAVQMPFGEFGGQSGELLGDRFDVVYFDAFAPDSQPELWTTQVFARLYSAMSDGGVLVTYSAKGDVKRALRAAGFTIERLSGAPGKRHMLRAIKKHYEENRD
ncbi:MAG: tRNA (5-methylaminomethyl-2-thiouridine)(34)-methyltransferase MnmD [Rikenellaceae bacterium]|nr:tRNA (5-methylaminomethyl-2-thiouridine)(34)-methyltransferase MnmD [Rikenellaceae bacterium]MCL2693268.1 tRNA (5-methylaminomethyl-2-thiouridine)(34)-methyltransferase MnmD [Rikenellaceae bacterium]